MIVLCIVVFIYFIFNITYIVNVFMLSIEKKLYCKMLQLSYKNNRLPYIYFFKIAETIVKHVF